MTPRIILLYPFAMLYKVVMALRNHLFAIGYSRSFKYDIMTINVGNLAVGGTGKTPMIEYLIRLLSSNYSLAALSRGYKRKTKGFILADETSNAHQLGDEPLQIFKKYGHGMVVAVGEERALAIPRILMEHPETQVVLLDDAYQHRTVSPDFNILLTQFAAPFYSDFVLPSGLLRESRKGANRADAIVITKCPIELDVGAKNQIIDHVYRYAHETVPIYFSSIAYGMPLSLIPNQKFKRRVLLFAGLSNMESLINYVQNSFELVETISYSDHHDYKMDDVEDLIARAKKQHAQLLTSEKDIMKLQSSEIINAVEKTGLFYLPISVQFLFNDDNLFNKFVFNAIAEKYKTQEEKSVEENL